MEINFRRWSALIFIYATKVSVSLLPHVETELTCIDEIGSLAVVLFHLLIMTMTLVGFFFGYEKDSVKKTNHDRNQVAYLELHCLDGRLPGCVDSTHCVSRLPDELDHGVECTADHHVLAGSDGGGFPLHDVAVAEDGAVVPDAADAAGIAVAVVVDAVGAPVVPFHA